MMLDEDDWLLVEGRGKTGDEPVAVSHNCWGATVARLQTNTALRRMLDKKSNTCSSSERHWSSFSFFSLRGLVETFLHDGQLKQENNIVA